MKRYVSFFELHKMYESINMKVVRKAIESVNMNTRYNRFFEKSMNYYKFILTADDIQQYKLFIKELYKYEKMFEYIKLEFDKPRKVGDQLRNTVYLSTDTLSLNQIYKIINSVKPSPITKLKDNPFYSDISAF